MRQDPAVSEQNPPATPLDETTPAVPPLLPAHVTQGTVVKMNVANSTAAVGGCLCSVIVMHYFFLLDFEYNQR